MNVRLLSVVVGFSVLISGCGQKTDDVAGEVDSPSVEEQIASTIDQLNQLYASSELSDAIEKSVSMFSSEDSPEVRQAIIRWGVDQISQSGDTAIVEGYILQLLELDEEFAGLATRMLTSMMLQDSPEAWIAFLTDESRPVMFRSFGYNIWLERFADTASEEDIQSVFVVLQDPAFQEYKLGLYRYALSRAMSHTDPNRIWNLLTYLDENLSDDAGLTDVVLHARGEALIRDSRLEDAFAFYRDHAEAMGDARVASVMFRLLNLAKEKNNTDLITSIREWGYGASEFTSVRNRIARWDLQQLRVEQEAVKLVESIRDVMAKDVPVQVISSYFLSNLYYPMLENADADGLQAIRDLVTSMNDAAGDAAEHIRSSLGSALLDVYFYQEDFKAALKLLRSGIPGFDEDWHAELVDKVQAHLAQQEGRLRDAIGFYEKHIERAKSWTKPFRAPESGRLVLPIEVIALNERRIGDLWKQEGEPEKAAAAYARALEHYQNALQEYKDAKDELSQVEMEKVLSELATENP